MTPTGPSGCHCSIIRWAGLSDCIVSAVEHARLADGEVGHVDHFLDFAVTLGLDLSDLERHERAELVLLFPQSLADQTDELAPLRRGDRAPCRERFADLRHDVLIVLGRAGPDRSNDFASRRIDGLEQRAGRVIRPPVFARAASRIHGLNAERFERGMDGTHR